MNQEKIIFNKSFNEITFGEMCDCEAKWDFICNGDKKVVHVCVKENEEK